MNFDFSAEQYMFQDSVRAFLDEKFDLAKLRALAESDGFDAQLWNGLLELGAFSMLIPEAHGGLGLTLVDLALVLEEFGRALVPPPIAETIAATDVLVRHATDEQNARLLPRIGEGALKLVPAIAEAQADFDPESMALTAVPSRNGWSVSGEKILVPQAMNADFMLVGMRFGENRPLGLALVEPRRAGVSLRPHTTLDPTCRFHEVTFQDVAIVRDDIVGGEPSPQSVQRLFDVSGMIAATEMTGIAGKVLDTAIDYAGKRTQFDKPIGSFQAIKHRCADIAVAVDASRSAAYYAAWALAETSEDWAKAVSMAKSYCGDTARFACNEGIQIHGGIGFTWELGLHYYLRRAKVLEYAFGDAAYHRERVLTSTLTQLAAGA
jgi:alkylation response protein AidB-like acyl-CoA dehydrogenase